MLKFRFDGPRRQDEAFTHSRRDAEYWDKNYFLS